VGEKQAVLFSSSLTISKSLGFLTAVRLEIFYGELVSRSLLLSSKGEVPPAATPPLDSNRCLFLFESSSVIWSSLKYGESSWGETAKFAVCR
jgi:hypothetical protein